MIATLHNMAHIAKQNEDYKQAVASFSKALLLAQETQRPYDIFDELRDLGILLCQLGNKKQGLPLLQQALQLGQQVGIPGTERIAQIIAHFSGTGTA
ncbi:MAG: tetratricopeptide repeat protein [Deferribacteres bacterium]|nr:tetratricopeptide repeat protein [Deferribacteres bacterium]